MTSPTYQRAMILFEQGRYADAAREFRATLASDPNNAHAHAMLSLTLLEQKKLSEATDEARQAIGIAPDLDLAHYAHALALHRRNRDDEAIAAITEAIRLDQWNPNYFSLLAGIRYEQRDWRAALSAADQGLALDPMHPNCLNLRAMALTQMGDRAAADATMAGALEEDPENAWTHANAGWAQLHRGKAKEALEHFKAALRLEPEMEYARAGVVEALKSRFFVYRWLLMFFLWVNRLSSGAQWGLMIGGYVGQRVIAGAARSNPAAAPYLWPIFWTYVGFVLLTWLAAPMLNLVLRLHPVGRYALSPDQRRGSEVTVALLLSGLATLIVGLVQDSAVIVQLGMTAILAALPGSRIFDCENGWPRLAQTGITLLVIALGCGAAWEASHEGAPLGPIFNLFIIVSIASQFATAGLVRQKPRL